MAARTLCTYFMHVLVYFSFDLCVAYTWAGILFVRHIPLPKNTVIRVTNADHQSRRHLAGFYSLERSNLRAFHRVPAIPLEARCQTGVKETNFIFYPSEEQVWFPPPRVSLSSTPFCNAGSTFPKVSERCLDLITLASCAEFLRELDTVRKCQNCNFSCQLAGRMAVESLSYRANTAFTCRDIKFARFASSLREFRVSSARMTRVNFYFETILGPRVIENKIAENVPR